MDDRLKGIFRELDRSRSILDDAVASVPSDRRTMSPPDGWSVAQILEHLVIVERRITALVARLIGESKDAPAAPVASTGFDRARVLDRTAKIKSRSAEPTGTVSIEDSFRALDAARDELKRTVSADHTINFATITAPHPVFGTLTLYEWVDFVGSHMQRHAAQIRELSP
jgi:hypothetical protein